MRKKIFFLLPFILLIVSCNKTTSKNLSPTDTFTAFIEAYQRGDYDTCNALAVGDTLSQPYREHSAAFETIIATDLAEKIPENSSQLSRQIDEKCLDLECTVLSESMNESKDQATLQVEGKSHDLGAILENTLSEKLPVLDAVDSKASKEKWVKDFKSDLLVGVRRSSSNINHKFTVKLTKVNDQWKVHLENQDLMNLLYANLYNEK